MTYTPKNTTAEYLAWIDYELNWLGEGKIVVGRNFRASLLANRDVLVRHEGKSDETESWCVECGEFKYYFPCPTYLDIAQRLDEVMQVSYLKQLPCETCYTHSFYFFPNKPTEKYCYCDFRYEIGEQIAQEIEAKIEKYALDESLTSDFVEIRIGGLREAAAIAKREPNQVTKDAIEEARKMSDPR